MTQDQEIDFSIMDANDRSETDHKINQIKNILKEEWLDNDPDLLEVFDQAIKEAIKEE